ncbi:MAG: AAA family ATPase [Gammaproteobacteria bacterium]|nr:AAA family ATPase [Gammaproteobacteria bacterium]
MSNQRPATLGALRESGYEVLPVREEMRRNLIVKLEEGEDVFPGIVGFDETVIPQVENAILAGQDIILLGERGQAKSRIIRMLTSLLDEWTPVIEGAEIPENPFAPITAQGREIVTKDGEDTAINWLHRDARYGEKLATPDITIADLIGEVDPIKIAEGRYLSDELTIHYGLIPRTNRGIFSINELPDLAERIQVGLLNAMEERDIQIKGHKVRLPLDVIIVATANPEDYTNRGRIITPLKDRYGSQIRTHYPTTIRDEMRIMDFEHADLDMGTRKLVVPPYMKEIVAELTRHARKSPDISQRSGVSVRASIANYESLVANALRRALRCAEQDVVPRISDLPFVIPSLQGKVEFETVEEGREDQVMERLMQAAVSAVFNRFVDLSELEPVVGAFAEGVSIETGEGLDSESYVDVIKQIDGLDAAVSRLAETQSPAERASAAEFILEGMHLNKLLNKDRVSGKTRYRAR